MSDAFVGLGLTIIIGLLWSTVGIYFKLMAKWEITPYNIGIISGTLGIIINLIFVTATGDFIPGRVERPSIYYLLFVLAAGFVNGSGSYILQRSMLYGQSGVTWAIGQSALIVPFLSITIFFSEPWNMFKLGGTMLIIAGMIIFTARNNKQRTDAPNPRYGLKLALVSFITLGIAQTMTSVTSFFSYTDPGNCRPLLALTGSFLATFAAKALRKEKGFYFPAKLYPVVFLLTLQNVIATALNFLALDYLSKCGMNGVFFPVAIGLCIAGYAIWSVLFFKEKATWIFVSGVSVILSGIACFIFAN